MLTARERVRLDPDEPQKARHGALDLVAERLGLGVPGELRGAERPDHVERHARGRAGRVDRDVRRVAQGLQALRADAARLEALAPDRRLLRGVLVRERPRRRSRPTRSPTGGSWRVRGRGRRARGSPCRPSDRGSSTGIPASSASSMRTIASPVFPEPVIPTTTPCVVRSLEPTTTRSPPGLPVAGSIVLPRWNEPRSAMCARV